MPFSEHWHDSTSEKSSTQKFWLQLLHDVLGVPEPGQFIEFEKPVSLKHKSYIDAFIPLTGTIIEQKSSGVDLVKPLTIPYPVFEVFDFGFSLFYHIIVHISVRLVGYAFH